MSTNTTSFTLQTCVLHREVVETHYGDTRFLTPLPMPVLFPWRLHSMLEWAEKEHLTHVVSWDARGKSFKIHDKYLFAVNIIPLWFHRQSKYRSFERQLNIWGFQRTEVPFSGGYYNIHFQRDDRSSFRFMERKGHQKLANSSEKFAPFAVTRRKNQTENLHTVAKPISDGNNIVSFDLGRQYKTTETSDETFSNDGGNESLNMLLTPTTSKRILTLLHLNIESEGQFGDTATTKQVETEFHYLNSSPSLVTLDADSSTCEEDHQYDTNETAFCLSSPKTPKKGLSSLSSSLDRWKYIQIGLGLAASVDQSLFQMLMRSTPNISSGDDLRVVKEPCFDTVFDFPDL